MGRIAKDLEAPGKYRIIMQQRVRQAREAMGLSQSQFGELLGTGISTVQAWEYGKSFPGPESLETLAEVTNYPVAWFFSEGPEDIAEMEAVTKRLQGIMDQPRPRADLAAILNRMRRAESELAAARAELEKHMQRREENQASIEASLAQIAEVTEAGKVQLPDEFFNDLLSELCGKQINAPLHVLLGPAKARLRVGTGWLSAQLTEYCQKYPNTLPFKLSSCGQDVIEFILKGTKGWEKWAPILATIMGIGTIDGELVWIPPEYTRKRLGRDALLRWCGNCELLRLLDPKASCDIHS